MDPYGQNYHCKNVYFEQNIYDEEQKTGHNKKLLACGNWYPVILVAKSSFWLLRLRLCLMSSKIQFIAAEGNY